MFINKIQKSLTELKEDNTSGANELINKALDILQYQAEILSNQSEDIKNKILMLSKQIINSRPSMAPLINTIGYIIQDLEVITKKDVLSRIELFIQNKLNIGKALKKNFYDFMFSNGKDIHKIMLISYSSTIMQLLNQLKDRDIEFYIMESRPLFEGHHTAKILSANFQIHLIVDAAIGKFMDQMDLVLIGIDSILKDGAIINKIGTFPLSVVAYEKGIDVYAIGDSLKYNLKSHFGLKVEIEEKSKEEVFKLETPERNLIVHNYYFDITPSKYIKGIISDLGILKPQEFVNRVKKILPIDWFQKFLNNND